MADILVVVEGSAKKVYRDMGDGTWAEVVCLAATPSIDIGDVQLLAGTALVGKVGIDQTTPGTTNRVTATLDAETTKVIGTINVAASQTIATTIAVPSSYARSEE